MIIYAYNPSWEVKTGGLRVWVHLGLHHELSASLNHIATPWLQNSNLRMHLRGRVDFLTWSKSQVQPLPLDKGKQKRKEKDKVKTWCKWPRARTREFVFSDYCQLGVYHPGRFCKVFSIPRNIHTGVFLITDLNLWWSWDDETTFHHRWRNERELFSWYWKQSYWIPCKIRVRGAEKISMNSAHRLL